MDVLVIRHAMSEANIMNTSVRNETACLTELGIQQARKLGGRLVGEYGFDIHQPVAVSNLLRTQQTADEAGFTDMTPYRLLDEIKGMALPDLRRYMENGKLPIEAIERAEAILESPPEEPIWFSHGFVIAGLKIVLGLPQDDRLVSNLCDITEMDITKST